MSLAGEKTGLELLIAAKEMLADKALAQFVLRLIWRTLGTGPERQQRGSLISEPLFSKPEKDEGEYCEWEKGGVKRMSQGQASEESSGLSSACKTQTKACHSEPISLKTSRHAFTEHSHLIKTTGLATGKTE